MADRKSHEKSPAEQPEYAVLSERRPPAPSLLTGTPPRPEKADPRCPAPHRVRRQQRAGSPLLVDWPKILERQRAQGWGAKVIERLSHDLQIELPGVERYSPRNLKYMRTLAEVWPDPEKVPQPVALLPWGHQRVLLDQLKDPALREWYLRAAFEYGWSRNVLVPPDKEPSAREGGKGADQLRLPCYPLTRIWPNRF